MYASLRPMRSPTLLPIRMNAAETSASSAIADWTPLAVVPISWTTAEIDTFISDVSTTSTNMAIASRMASRWLLLVVVSGISALALWVMGRKHARQLGVALSPSGGYVNRWQTPGEPRSTLRRLRRLAGGRIGPP